MNAFRGRDVRTVAALRLREQIGAMHVRYLGVLILLAGAIAVGSVVLAMSDRQSRLSEAVLVIAVAGSCILALRFVVAVAAGSLAASQQSRGRRRGGRRRGRKAGR